jgi:replicative DNA helicase
MALEVYSMVDTLNAAVDSFFLDREGRPEIIATGFSIVDEELGGLGPASCGILAAATSVGKSSALIAAALSSPTPVGIISLEDGPDVIGARVLAHLTGINSRYIRRKFLTDPELKRVNKAAKSGAANHIAFTYPEGKLGAVEEAVAALASRGCRLVWLDYLQKVRGHGGNDRRNEVAATFTAFQQACKRDGIAGMAVSQFRRLTDGEKVPSIHHLKESGDLENEARLIILAHKLTVDPDTLPKGAPPVGNRVRFHVAKSVFGGEEIEFDMLRDEAGSLQPATLFAVPKAPLPGSEIDF